MNTFTHIVLCTLAKGFLEMESWVMENVYIFKNDFTAKLFYIIYETILNRGKQLSE